MNRKELESELEGAEKDPPPPKSGPKRRWKKEEAKDKLADYRADPRRMGSFIEPKYT